MTKGEEPEDEVPRARWDQLRGATDAGQIGDKVKYPDPAAAPLGADEEAGGHTTPHAAIDRTLRRERETAPPIRNRPANEAPDTRRKTTWVYAVVALVILVGLLAILCLRA